MNYDINDTGNISDEFPQTIDIDSVKIELSDDAEKNKK